MTLLDRPGDPPRVTGSLLSTPLEAPVPSHRQPAAAAGADAPDTGGAQGRGATARTLQTELVTGLDAVARLRTPWLDLFGNGGLGNPHLHPDWLLSWYATFVQPEDVVAVTVTAGDRLVGLAPLWRMRVRRRRGPVVCVQLAGAGRGVDLVDLPGVLTAAGMHRKAVAAMGPGLAAVGGHWTTLTLDPQQGWSDLLLPSQAATVVPRPGRTCPVTPLTDEGNCFAGGLKRNVRESLRRARNRLDRSGRPWSVEALSPGDARFGAALEELVRLHSGRAALPGRPAHLDALADPGNAAFLRAAAASPGAAGLLRVFRLVLDGRTIAALLVLFSAHAAMLSVSGMLAQAWEFSPMALLIQAAAGDAAARGCRELNHSPGPDVSKLRWTDALRTHHEFHLARTDPMSRLLFGGFTQASAALAVRRERRRGRPPSGGPSA